MDEWRRKKRKLEGNFKVLFRPLTAIVEKSAAGSGIITADWRQNARRPPRENMMAVTAYARGSAQLNRGSAEVASPRHISA